ncbi:MAG: 3-oxo-tetronate kinase [Pseudomonadota bacterium]
MTPLLGCVADDLTGATDIALALCNHGMSTSVSIGTPGGKTIQTDAAAHVVALKSRTAAAESAVVASRASIAALRASGCQRFFFKYCSTFDSTADGNIGPVIDALLDELSAQSAVVCPAFPANGRTMSAGVLLVDGVPLAETPMRDHPLTPMRESSVPRLLDAQANGPPSTLIALETVRNGSAAIRTELSAAVNSGSRYIVIDAESDEDLARIAKAVGDTPLLTGSAGLGAALPEAYRNSRLLEGAASSAPLPSVPGPTAILAGSCSAATLRQIDRAAGSVASYYVDILTLQTDTDEFDAFCRTVAEASASGDVIVYTSTAAPALKEVQAKLGVSNAADRAESLLAETAAFLKHQGVRRFIVAGGETSGAVAAALNVDKLDVGPEIEPGVPWMIGRDPEALLIAFKSGNFGSDDFFQHAIKVAA